LKQRYFRGAHRSLEYWLGSKASRTASPMKTMSRSVMNIAARGKKTSHHLVRLSTPCSISSPQLGVGAGRPKPRKSSATSAAILATIMKGAKETTGVSELGKTCLKIIAESEAPMEVAAAT